MILNEVYKQTITPSLSNPIKAKNLGQYFTGKRVSAYMASMIGLAPNKDKDDQVRILDAGAGKGVLAVSAVIRCISIGYTNIHVTLYEIDEELIPYLEEKVNKLKGARSKEFAKRLEEYGENLTELSLNNKFSRDVFSTVSFFKYMKALDIEALREEEWR